MGKQQALGRCSRSPSSSRPAELLPALGAAAEMGVGQHCPWRMGTSWGQQWEVVARQGLGTEGQQGGNVSQEEGQAACKARSKHLTLSSVRDTNPSLSIVPRNVADMLQCGVRTGWKAHGEVKAQVVLAVIHHSQSTSRTQQSASQHMV